jgi:hypothetical protein
MRQPVNMSAICPRALATQVFIQWKDLGTNGRGGWVWEELVGRKVKFNDGLDFNFEMVSLYSLG